MKKVKLLILGKSNVGKSSLINHLTQNHISLVSNKIHATRLSSFYDFKLKDFLIQFIDTPGISITDNNLLAKAMKSNAQKHFTNCDLIILLTQLQNSYEYESAIMEDVYSTNKPYIICVNKIDQKQNNKYLTLLQQELNTKDYSMISIKENIGISGLINDILSKIENINNFTEYKIDKKNNLYIIQELIRESLINTTNEEVPYESAVRIISYAKQKNTDQINAEVIVTKENHKKIIIGKNGKMIKAIGIKARKNIESLLNKRINLSLFVLVKENWKNNQNLLKDFGYID